MTDCWTLYLPSPISVNALFVNRSKGRGRMISPKYLAWRKEAEGALWQQKPLRQFKGPVTLNIAIQYPKNGNADLDNQIKCLSDFLVAHGVIEGDNCKTVKALHVAWADDVKGAKITILKRAY